MTVSSCTHNATSCSLAVATKMLQRVPECSCEDGVTTLDDLFMPQCS